MAWSLTSLLRQRTLPVFLSRAATNPLGPPGVMITRSPSISGDQLKPQPGLLAVGQVMGLTSAPITTGRSFFQSCFPAVSVQSRIPWLPTATIVSPLTAGVPLGPLLHWLRSKSNSGPMGVAQSSAPLLFRPNRYSVPLRDPIK